MRPLTIRLRVECYEKTRAKNDDDDCLPSTHRAASRRFSNE